MHWTELIAPTKERKTSMPRLQPNQDQHEEMTLLYSH